MGGSAGVPRHSSRILKEIEEFAKGPEVEHCEHRYRLTHDQIPFSDRGCDTMTVTLAARYWCPTDWQMADSTGQIPKALFQCKR